jgi:HEPN domain-containing protein
MQPLTREWVSKAEGDYATARREVRARRQPNFDAACFHVQQCAEKYLKALLLERGLVVARTHNLEALAKPLLAAHPQLKQLAAKLRTLTAYAVETRYPGKSADRGLGREAVMLCAEIRTAVRGALRISK